ncbi:MAG: glycosyltransferase, partial [Limisphaerales bacterium]
MHQERPMRILHLVGDHEDAGGVLSVIRNLQGVSSKNQLEHVVWVKQGYQEKRTPPLTYRHASSVIAESVNHWKLLAMAWPAYRELKALLEEEAFDVIHAHSRGTLLIGILVAKRMQRRVLFTNHNYAQRTGLYRWASRQHRMHTVLLTPNMAKHYRLDCSASKTSIISACYDASLLERPVKQPGR